MPHTIRKVVISAFGDETNVNVTSAEIADPSKGEVQVRIIYSGFNGGDTNMRMGRYPMQRKPPLTPGYCLVGKVSQNGSGSTRFTPGTVVASLTVYDAEAELINLPEKYLIPVPDGLDLQKVCATVLDWTTAYGLVHRAGKVRAGQSVFVHGLSGAVGLATASLCRLQGAEVYGTASQRNHDQLKDLGFKPFVYTDKNWMTTMKNNGGADVVFDALGYTSYDESYSILSKQGCLVGYGTNLATLENQATRGTVFTIVKLLARNLLSPITGKHTKFHYITRDDPTFEPELTSLFDLLAQGKIDVQIKKVFDMEDIQDAHRYWAKGGQGIGSMLISIGSK